MVRRRVECHARRMVGERPSGRDIRRAACAAAASAIALCACPAPVHPMGSTAASDEIVLYRDRAVVLLRVELAAPRTGATQLALQLPAGLEPSDAVILDRGELADAVLRAAS